MRSATPSGDKAKNGRQLTGKEQLFVNAYLSEARFNATEAARIAGYKGSQNTLSSVGYEVLRKPEIAAEVARRVNESAMPVNEVLTRLSNIASGDITDCVNDDGKFDLALAKERGITPLLKKLKVKSTSKRVDSISGDSDERETLETALVYEEVEFEMYSAHEALRDLGKYHKLFTEKHEISNPDGSPLLQPVADAITKIYGASKSE